MSLSFVSASKDVVIGYPSPGMFHFAGMMEEVARGLSMQQQQAQQYAQQQSPTNNQHFSFSRASSLGSVNAISCSSASSTHNTGQICGPF